jgi:long-chain fatty acid transport protein
MSRTSLGAALAAAVGGSVFLASLPASAGGLFLPSRGVRAGARGGAFVAGADDVDSLWYDPAGLATLAGGKQKDQVRVDFALVDHSVDYTRVDSGGNPQATVTNDPQKIPLPTIAAAFDLGKNWVLGVGLFTPWASLDQYPETGAQRYSTISLHYTTIAFLDVGLGWKLTDKLYLGASLSNMFFGFHSRVMFSACPSEIACAPENPDWDSLAELESTTPFNPSGALGVRYLAGKRVSLGASVRLPYIVSADGHVRSRLPSSSFFDGAHVEGDAGTLDMTFPAMIRAGIELVPANRWRVELGTDIELWSEQDKITLTPHNVRIEDQAGVGIYDLGKVVIPRKFDDTVAINLGVEGQPLPLVPLTLRAGYVFETGAAPDAYLSVLTPDSQKHLLSFGVGYRVGKLRFDAVFAHAFVATRNVDQATTCVPLLNPIRTGQGQASDSACVHDGAPEHVYVGAGKYTSGWTTFGLGMNADF